MDKNAYLKELSRHLSRRMPEREGTLRWYEEYFQEAGPEREAEVIKELGSPETVARRVAEEGGWNQEKARPQPGDGRWDCRSRGAVDCRAVCGHLGRFAAHRPAPDDPAASPGASTNQQAPDGAYGMPRLNCAPEECSWMLTSGVGSIQVDGDTSLLSSSHKAPDGSYQLTGSTGLGSVSVTFS